MIQRIQTIFLALASGTFAGQFLLPFASSEGKEQVFFEDSIYNIQDHVGLLIITILGIVGALGAIFLFKNRPLQLRITYISIVMAILLPILAIWLFFNAGHQMVEGNGVEDGLGLYLPVLGVVFSGLAARFIKKDDKLVKSMDRLR